MKIHLFFLLLLLFSYQQADAQMLCSYAGQSSSYGQGLETPNKSTIETVNEICDFLEISHIPVYRGNVPNACATYVNGRAVIIYNRTWMISIGQQLGEYAQISIFAHEVGHHLNMDLSWYGQFKHSWTKELQSDFVSGYVLRMYGATLEETQRALRATFDYFGSPSHPDTFKRLDAITQGWIAGQ